MLGARVLVFSFLIVILAPLSFASSLAQDPCIAQGKKSRISTGTGSDATYPAGTVICEGDDKKLWGGCDSDPYPFLEQRHTGKPPISFVTPVGASQGSTNLQYGLNPILACRLKKFLEQAEQKGCSFKINSAMRPTQRCTPGPGCAPQGVSCHQYGLAVDMNGSLTCLSWMTQVLGRKNASSPFGLHVAYTEVGPGYRHLQCSENVQAACSPQTQGCGGNYNVTGGDLSGVPGPGSYTQPPTTGMANQLRQALGMQQQPPSLTSPSSNTNTSPNLTSPTTNPVTQPTPTQICIPEYRCSGKALQYHSAYCVTQAVETCAYGCENGRCLAASSSTSTPRTPTTGTSTGSITAPIALSLSSTTLTTTPTNVTTGPTESESLLGLLRDIGGDTAVTELGTTTIASSTPLQLIESIQTQQVQAIASSTPFYLIETTKVQQVQAIASSTPFYLIETTKVQQVQAIDSNIPPQNIKSASMQQTHLTAPSPSPQLVENVPTQQVRTVATSAPPQNQQHTTIVIMQPTPTQTFTSPNLGVTQNTGQSAAQKSGLLAILEGLKNILLRMLDFIQPFSPARYGGHAGE
jgi:hypothetical protein